MLLVASPLLKWLITRLSFLTSHCQPFLLMAPSLLESNFPLQRRRWHDQGNVVEMIRCRWIAWISWWLGMTVCDCNTLGAIHFYLSALELIFSPAHVYHTTKVGSGKKAVTDIADSSSRQMWDSAMMVQGDIFARQAAVSTKRGTYCSRCTHKWRSSLALRFMEVAWNVTLTQKPQIPVWILPVWIVPSTARMSPRSSTYEKLLEHAKENLKLTE